jgi:putative transposase
VDYLYFLGLSFRNSAKVLSFLLSVKSCFNLEQIQKYKPQELKKKKKIDEYIIDETIVKAGSKLIWLWIAIIESTKDREILSKTY